jgi:hypothetical protein
MQIHEITKIQLQEGLFDAFKTPEKIAAQAAEKLQAQGYGQRKPLPAVQDSVAAVQKNPAQQQYIKGLVAQWQQSAPKAPASKTTATTTPAPSTTKTAATPQRSAQPSITIGGKLLTKGGDGLWHGETGAAVTDPAQAAKIDKAYRDQEYRKKQFQQTAIVREAPAEYTTPSGIVVPGGAKTDQTPATAGTEYRDAFVKWAGEKLRTVDPTTNQAITLDQVNSTPEIDIKDELDRALAQVVATAGDPTKNTVAVNNYLTIAVAGVARASQKLRQDRVYGSSDNANKTNMSTSTGQAGQAIVTQQEIRNKLAQEVGLSKTQIDALNKLGQDPAARAALLKSFGVQA